MSQQSSFPNGGGWRLQGAVSVQTIATVAVLVIVLAVIGYWVLSPSPEELLDRASLTPRQIRVVATKLLLHEDLALRARASQKLTSLGEAAVPVLRDIALGSSDEQLRFAVCGILAQLNPEVAVDVFEQMAGDRNPSVRKRAVGAAAPLNHPRALALIDKASTDPEVGVRTAVAAALGSKLDDPQSQAREKLLAMLEKEPNKSLRNHIRRVLGLPSEK